MEDAKEIARRARKTIIETIYGAKDAHIGCALSCVDILTALFFRVMNTNPSDPKDPSRDRFILSKGHGVAAVYAVMSERGFFKKEALADYAKDGSPIASHVEKDVLPGVETNGGSGGHGLSLGVGMALTGIADAKKFKVFVLMGDGELQEGSAWEAAMFAASRNLANVKLIIDRNVYQTWTKVDDVVAIEPLAEKFRAFGWEADEVDGHDIEALAALMTKNMAKPHAIIAHTTKGKGVSFMEGSGDWHNGVMTQDQYDVAIKELS